MIQKKFFQIATQHLKKTDREAYEHCKAMCTPKLTDLSLVPAIFQEIAKTIDLNPVNSHFIVSVIYYLYVPYKLVYTDVRAPNGIRYAICEQMGWNDGPTVNHYAAKIISYSKNPRYVKKVSEMGDDLYNQFKTA